MALLPRKDSHLLVEHRRPHPRFPDRRERQKEAVEFFMAFIDADIPCIAVENPVSIMSTVYRKPDQIIQPWMFGDAFSKKTCLWLKNLPLLQPTKIVDQGDYWITKSGKKMPSWFYSSEVMKLSKEERSKLRSRTFKGFAEALANQWG